MLCRAGKRELPPPLRSRFTELYIAPLTAREDLCAFVAAYLRPAAPDPPVDAVVDFYLAARTDAVCRITLVMSRSRRSLLRSKSIVT